MKKSTKAITLIALIITIIVLLILVAVTINMVLGDNGLFNKAKYASESYTNAAQKEETEIAKTTNEIDTYTIGGTRLTEEEYNTLKADIISEIQNEENGIYSIEKQDNYVITKYYNGIMELSGNTGQITLKTGSSSWGGQYYTPEKTLQFPVTFNSVISANLSCITNDEGVLLITPLFCTNSSINYYTFRPNANCTVKPIIHYHIVGTWK